MLLDELLAGAKRLRAGAAPAAGARGICVVACADPHLDLVLAPCLGLLAGDALFVRVPGFGSSDSAPELARQVALAVHGSGCTEVLVVGHSNCSLRGLDVEAAVNRASARGVSRGLFGAEPARFFGAGGAPGGPTLELTAALRRSPLLPRDLPVHALLLDEAAGDVVVLEAGYGIVEHAEPPGLGAGMTLGLTRGPIALGLGLPPLPQLEFAPLDFQVVLPTVSPFELSRTVLPALSELNMAVPNLDFGTAELPTASPMELVRTVLPTISMDFGSGPASSGPVETAVWMVSPAPRPVPVQDTSSSPPPRDWAQPALQATEVLRPPPASPPPPLPKSAARKPARTTDLEIPHADLDAGLVHGAKVVRLSAGLTRSLVRVRAFYRAEFRSNVRNEVRDALDAAAARGLEPAELAKAAIKPILEAGQKRYSVINDLVAIKEGVEGLDGASAHAALRSLLE